MHDVDAALSEERYMPCAWLQGGGVDDTDMDQRERC